MPAKAKSKRRPQVASRKAARNRTAKTARKRAANRSVEVKDLLPKGDGGAVTLAIAERSGDGVDTASGRWKGALGVARLKAQKAKRKTTSKRKGGSAGKAGPVALAACSRAFAGAANPARAKMLLAMLDGPATYQSLCAATGLKAGPLYHHVNQLRLAGLVLPGARDLYELTRGGRNLILTMLAVAPLVRDGRRRP